MQFQPTTFGNRLRQIRKTRGLTQEELANIVGTSKQALSRYEKDQRAPKVTIAREYAEKLGVPLSFMLGEPGEWHPQPGKPSSEVFAELVRKITLNMEEIAERTGLDKEQIEYVTKSQGNDATLILSWHLAETFGVPTEVFAGDMCIQPPYISLEARIIAIAYDYADLKCKNIVRMALDQYVFQKIPEEFINKLDNEVI